MARTNGGIRKLRPIPDTKGAAMLSYTTNFWLTVQLAISSWAMTLRLTPPPREIWPDRLDAGLGPYRETQCADWDRVVGVLHVLDCASPVFIVRPRAPGGLPVPAPVDAQSRVCRGE